MTKRQTPQSEQTFGALKTAGKMSSEHIHYSTMGEPSNHSTQQHKLGFYSSHSSTAPSQYIDLQGLAELCEQPYSTEKKRLPLIVPHDGKGKTQEAAVQAKYWVVVIDYDGINETMPDLVSKLAMHDYNGTFLYYTTSSHGSTLDDKGSPKPPHHYKIIIPLDRPHSASEHLTLSEGLAILLGSDKAQSRVQQGFYAPNSKTSGLDYEGEAVNLSDGYLTPDCNLYKEAIKAYGQEQEKQAKKIAATVKPKPKPHSINRHGQSIIELINSRYDLENLLAAAGYSLLGRKWLSPNSKTGSPGGVIFQNDDKERFYSHHGESCLLSALNHNGHALDTADVLCFTRYGGDYEAMVKAEADKLDPQGQKQRQREYMAQQDSKKAPANPFDTPPYNLFNTFEPAPLDLTLLPQPIAAFAQEQGELIGTDPAAIAVFCLGAAAACIDDRIKLQPKRHDPTWTESARLWVGVIGDPSTKKSPALSKALGPLFQIDRQWRAETHKAIAEWEEKAKNASDDEALPPRPLKKRMLISDATVEKIGDILSEAEPRGILSYQDELSGWLGSMDAYKQGAGGKDKAAWLEAYNGGYKAIDRIRRGELLVENWSVSVVGGIQPNVIHQYAQSTDHDGMLQRFILVHAQSAHMGADRPLDPFVSLDYKNLIEHLANTQPGNAAVKLSEGAHRHREALDKQMHSLACYHPNKFLSAALGKYSGLFARLLLLWHCIECYEQNKHPCDINVGEKTAEKVRRFIGGFLLPHAMAFYQELDPMQDLGQGLARLILARSWERFTVKRDLSQNWREWRRLKEWEKEDLLDRLDGFGWIAPDPSAGLNERGRPSAYLVNQEVHRLHAAKAAAERERRRKVAEAINELKASN